MKLSQAQAITEAAIEFAMGLKDGRDAQYVVPYLMSGAGIGKTTLIKDIAAKRKIGCEIVSLAQYDAGELGGWALPSDDGESMVRKRPDWLTWLIVVVVTIIGVTIIALWWYCLLN